MHRMSPQDASFLHVERSSQPMHIGSVAVFEGPPPGREEMQRLVSSKLHRVPRYRQRVRFVPLALERPVWVDDPHFHLDYHLRETGLPRPGGPEELRRLVGRVMAQTLDRDKPLWEMWVVEGLEDDHWALISKTHHCMVDGIAGTDLLAEVLDREPDAEVGEPRAWAPEREPSSVDLLVNAALVRTTDPREVVRGARAALRSPRRAVSTAQELARGFAELAGAAAPVARSSLTGMSGPHRRWSYARMTLADVKTVRRSLGGTVNDVVLAAVTGGYRSLLQAHGDQVSGTVLRSLVPVSTRRPDEVGTPNNRVSAMFADLPVGLDDPVERLRSLSEQMDRLKASGEAVAADRLVGLSGFAPPPLLALGARVTARAPQRGVNTVTTNVPGPQKPLYAYGRRLLEAFPYVPIGTSMRVGTAIFSYDGQLNIGVTADYDSVPDLTPYTSGVEDAMAELVKAAQLSEPAAAR